MEKIIGVYVISNTLTVNIYDIDYGIESKMLAGANLEESEWCTIQNGLDEFGNDYIYIKFGEMEIPLNEIMRL